MSNEAWTLEAYLRAGQRPDVMLVDVDHPDGAQYFHTGLGIIEYGGNEYIGTGRLGGIAIGGDGSQVEVTDVTLTLSGVDTETLDMLDTSVKGGTVDIVQAFLRPDFSIDQVIQIESADMDFMTYKTDGTTGTIILKALGGFRELLRRSTAHWDPEEQRGYLTSLGEDPDSDTGFDLMAQMKNTLIVSLAE